MSLTTQPAVIGGVTKNLIVAADPSGNLAAAHVTVDAGGAVIGIAQDGTDATGVTPPAGGVGIRGWLSGIYARLNTTLAVSVAALPLPSGAATDVTLASINTKLASLLAAELPYQGVVPMTVGTAVAPQRALRINCTIAGNVSITYADNSTDVIPINAGLNYVAGAITTVNSSGTTATATYANMK